jgi:hypothetical protein
VLAGLEMTAPNRQQVENIRLHCSAVPERPAIEALSCHVIIVAGNVNPLALKASMDFKVGSRGWCYLLDLGITYEVARGASDWISNDARPEASAVLRTRHPSPSNFPSSRAVASALSGKLVARSSGV